jgi:hypothetical protein
MLTELRTGAAICSGPLGLLGLLVLRAGCGLGQVALGTWRVEDERSGLGVFLFGDGGEGAEELVGDVGEDGGAAGGDFCLGLGGGSGGRGNC